MLSHLNYLLVAATCFVSACTAIRVDWNTNTGPIIPPTPRTVITPVPPFREPAPVWEDLSNDIPNPNPYVYILPPASRPRQRLHTSVNYYPIVGKNFGTLVASQNSDAYSNNNSHQVASLSPQYIPNVGIRYVAVVPTSTTTKSSTAFNNNPQTPSPSPSNDQISNKFQGKYNEKTKKYKAYQKVKNVPLNNNFPSKASDKTTVAPSSLLSDKQFNEQKLPADNIKQKWTSLFHSTDTTEIPLKLSPSFKTYTKHVYAKDKTTIKPKEKFNHSVDKAKKS